jgi:hypothetical protein
MKFHDVTASFASIEHLEVVAVGIMVVAGQLDDFRDAAPAGRAF